MLLPVQKPATPTPAPLVPTVPPVCRSGASAARRGVPHADSQAVALAAPHSVSHTARRRRLADRLGASASLLCALHCALLPIAVAAVPALGLGLLGGVGFERGFTLFATVLAVATLVSGYRRHRTLGALMFLVPGVLALWFGAFGPLGHEGVVHAVVMTVGGTLVAAAHLLNIRLAHGHMHDAGCGHLH